MSNKRHRTEGSVKVVVHGGGDGSSRVGGGENRSILTRSIRLSIRYMSIGTALSATNYVPCRRRDGLYISYQRCVFVINSLSCSVFPIF